MSDRVRLALLSFLMLFVELALIRWTGSNVVYLSYFSNFVLLGSFLGIGLGFLRAGRSRQLFSWAPVALLALVAFVRFFPVDIRQSTGGNLLFFSALRTSGPPRVLVLTVIFLVVAATMAFIADGVARSFSRFEPLEAYFLDLVGAIGGIVSFSLLSFLRAPPVVWGLVAAALLFVLLRPGVKVIQLLALGGMVAILLAESLASNASWSPYYKVTVRPGGGNTPFVYVNGVPHQAILRSHGNPLYTTLYERVRPRSLDDVLIIGAGGGNDVSVALSKGARRVDAVEIDPRLYQLGKELHPEHPYEDKRVHIHIDDGRAFLERTNRRYDLILLALPDSITLLPGQSSLRLESYLFTTEAMRAARDHLKPGGAFAMYNYYRQDWLLQRFARTLASNYGHSPCIDNFGDVDHFAILTVAESTDSFHCAAHNTPVAKNAPAPATDDHPFPYLRTRGLPAFYLQVIGLILLASLLLVRVTSGPFRSMVPYADLFFMGAAFLLLETKNVVGFALLFGTTWFVNALVFTGILLVVLVAVVIAQRVTFSRPGVLYGALLVSVAVAFVVPPRLLLELAVVPRFFAAAALAFAPIFLANLVFSQRFKAVASSTVAFGANLLGAMFGGLLEYVALVTGYRALLIAVAVLYGLAFAFGRRHLRDLAPTAAR